MTRLVRYGASVLAVAALTSCQGATRPYGPCLTGELSGSLCASVVGTLLGPGGTPAATVLLQSRAIADSISGAPSGALATTSQSGGFAMFWSWYNIQLALSDSAKLRLFAVRPISAAGPATFVDSIDIYVHIFRVGGPYVPDTVRWTLRTLP